jgi:hypothetical protein
VTVGSVLQLKTNEKKAYESIIVGRRAADAINSAVVNNQQSHKGKNAWKSTVNKLRIFSRSKNLESCQEHLTISKAKRINSKTEMICQRADRILEKLEKFQKRLIIS